MSKEKYVRQVVANNARAHHDYFIEEEYEAGLVLQGWEVKSLRHKRVSLKQAYAYIKNGEAWLLGAHISPLASCAQATMADAKRTRKLLLNKREINKLFNARQRTGYTLVVLSAYWKNQHIKIKLGLGKGKKSHDKRADEKKRDWLKEKQRILKKSQR